MKNKSSSVVGCYRNFNPPWGVVVVIDGLGHLFGLHPTRSDARHHRRRVDAILRRSEYSCDRCHGIGAVKAGQGWAGFCPCTKATEEETDQTEADPVTP